MPCRVRGWGAPLPDSQPCREARKTRSPSDTFDDQALEMSGESLPPAFLYLARVLVTPDMPQQMRSQSLRATVLHTHSLQSQAALPGGRAYQHTAVSSSGVAQGSLEYQEGSGRRAVKRCTLHDARSHRQCPGGA